MRELAPGWTTSPLGRLVDISIGGTPSRDIPRYWAIEGAEGFPWVAISDLHERVITNTKEQITSAGVANSNVKPVATGTVLMSFKLSLGRMAFAGTDLFTNEAIAAFKSRGEIDEQYLYYVLPEAVRRTATDVAIKGATLNKKSLASLQISHPALNAQKAIARVLASIDTAIEKTEALIAKHQQIKAGLMHDLFTRGVLSNGQLRPPRSEAPELYQETAMGWIPRDWVVATMQELLAPLPSNIRSGPFGSALLKHELVEEGIPFLGIDNIHTERFEPTFRRFVSERKFRELAKYRVRPRDVVITIMGTVGRCCVIPADLDVSLSSKHLWTMTFDTEKVIPELVCWQLNFAPWALAWFRRAMQGGIMDAIQSSTLKTLKLPVPGLEEQALIYARYLKMTERIQRDDEQLQKLQKQKLGLMQDLLTGRVPVPVPAEPAEAAA